MAGIFYVGEVGVPRGGLCNGADFTGISKFPEILGKLSMRKQCVPGSFLPAHARAWERGYAKSSPVSVKHIFEHNLTIS